MLNQEIELINRRIYELALPLCEAAGIELIDIHVKGHLRNLNIEVIVDKPTGGIGIDACAHLNRALADSIDKQAVLDEDVYSLEVSSPGLDRPLKTFKDFLRNKGFKVSVTLSQPFEGKKEYQGSIIDANMDILALNLKQGNVLNIPLDLIVKGVLII